MLKRFLDGLIFGAGFALAFIVLWSIWLWTFPMMLKSSWQPDEVSQTSPPELQQQERYLGSSGMYSGDFVDKRKVLAEGPGVIKGRAEVSGRPATGLRLRLALNGEVKSQWAVVDENGRYAVPVPYGEYRVDGYELDSGSANRVLAGKIDLDRFYLMRAVLPVSETSKGLGIDFTFVDPVRLDLAKKQFSLSEDVIINWHPYPGASQYRLQIHETPNPNSYAYGNELFAWDAQPVVSETSVDLKKLGAQLKADYYYSVTIQALDEQMKVMSETARNGLAYDFRVKQ